MNFKEWLLNEASISKVGDHIFKSIQLINDGEWEMIDYKRLLPAFRHQAYGVVEISGKNVRMKSDKFYVKVFYFVNKKEKEMEYPPGYFGGQDWWGPSVSPERIKKELEYGKPFDIVKNYDPKVGHRLLWFRGFIEGWRPGIMPGAELDYKTSAAIKGYPIPVSSPGDFRHDMERIDDFDPLHTPKEIADFVKKSIDKFYGRDHDFGDKIPLTPQAPTFVNI